VDLEDPLEEVSGETVAAAAPQDRNAIHQIVSKVEKL
jgi:hypothetical protein